MKQPSKQRGFTIIEVVILVVVILILGLLAFIAVRQLTAKKSTSTTSTSAQANIDSAKKATQTFYDAYVNSPANPRPSSASLVSKYGTANLVSEYAKRTDSDPILCGQNSAPTSVTNGVAASDGSYTVTVQEKFDTPTTLTVKVIKSGSDFKIDTVTCPGTDGSTSASASASTGTTTTSGSSSSTSSTSSSSSSDPAATKTAVFRFTQQFFDEYTAYRNGTESVSASTQAALKKYGTQNAINNFAASAKPCLQNTPEDASVTATLTTVSPYTVDVLYEYNGSSSIEFHVQVVDSGSSYQIDSQTCIGEYNGAEN